MEQDARKAQVPIKGRGSASRVPSRFDATTTVGIDDGWESVYEDLQELPQLRTEVTEERARSVISRNNSPDVGFSASVNPYRGCEHGCVYCFARPSHSYLSLSPGLDFETKLFAKTNAAERLRSELSRPSYQCAAIALGINTDGYQPIERSYQITRQCLELLAETRHPVSFVTKSALITRDIDLLAAMAKDRLVTVYFSVTTLDRKLSAKLEPRAAAPHARLPCRLGGDSLLRIRASRASPWRQQLDQRPLSSGHVATNGGAGVCLHPWSVDAPSVSPSGTRHRADLSLLRGAAGGRKKRQIQPPQDLHGVWEARKRAALPLIRTD